MTDEGEVKIPEPVEETDQTTRVIRLEASAEFSGPLPHPAILRQYEEVEPGSAGRIISMAENQQAHDLEMERETFKIVPEMFRQREHTHRWWRVLPATLLALALIAAFVAVTFMESATWQPYGVGGFIAVASAAISIYRVFGRRRRDE